jgi:hypothetical protein
MTNEIRRTKNEIRNKYVGFRSRFEGQCLCFVLRPSFFVLDSSFELFEFRSSSFCPEGA